jgi:hypothetical protein
MSRISPPRHQGHQARPPTLNAKAQRREGAKPTRPPQKRRGAETQRRRERDTDILCVARLPAVGRPGTAGNGIRHESLLSERIPLPAAGALRERRSRHLSSLFNRWEGHAPSPINERGERQNRCAYGTAACEKRCDDERSRSEFARFSQATGDPIACRSANTERHRVSSSAITSLRLCVFAGWKGGRALRSLRFLGGWAALRLCNSASLRFSWCSPLVSWCLGGSSFPRPSENRT